ncbi:MAG: FG-GAP-like repeat-containing protein [Gemmataceae bacterium]
MKRNRFRLSALPLESRENPAIHFRFDYSLDTTGFFQSADRRAALERAGAAITSQLNGSLSAITPSGSNTWSLTLTNPFTGSTVTKTNPSIGTDEILVYVSGAPSTGSELGFDAPTRYDASGDANWIQTVQTRGKSAGQFSTWGGMITFSQNVIWNFSTSLPTSTQNDFQSVAEHELIHVLGFGAGDPLFTKQVSGSKYLGSNVVSLMGGPVAVVVDTNYDNSPDHWAPGTTYGGQTPAMAPALSTGVRRLATMLDFAALADLGWSVKLAGNQFGPNSPIYGDPIGTAPNGEPIYTDHLDPSPVVPLTKNANAGATVAVVGAASGALPIITGHDASGRVTFTEQVFASSMTAGVRVAVGDFNADGTLDVAVGTGVGVATRVRVIDGKTGSELFAISPFESQFTGGVYLAAGDITGDGRADLAIAAGTGGGPRVRVFGGSSMTQLADFMTIEDTQFRGGVRPILGDFTGDRRADLIVAAGIGGGPRVAAFDGTSLATGSAPRKFMSDFFAGDPFLGDGAYLAVGDTNGDGVPDLVASSGATVNVFDGKSLGTKRTLTTISQFAPPTADTRGGAMVAVADVNGDGKPDVITFASLSQSKIQIASYNPITKQLLGYDA